MKLDRDRREFIELLNARDVRYVIVGAFALAHHGRPRYTGDIDFFVEASPENAERLNQVLEQLDLQMSESSRKISPPQIRLFNWASNPTGWI
jgi:hypothetical protein